MIAALSKVAPSALLRPAAAARSRLAEHALIDTRRLDGQGHSTGNAFNVELISPTIDIKNGAQILAQAVNFNSSTYTSGNVALIATMVDHQGQAPSSATTSITIAGTITGGAISATANSDASTVFLNSALGMAQFGASAVFGALTGLNGGYVKSEASAKVTVEGTANINATGAVTLASIGSEVAQDPVITFSLGTLQNAVAAGVVVGVVNADIATHVQSGRDDFCRQSLRGRRQQCRSCRHFACFHVHDGRGRVAGLFNRHVEHQGARRSRRRSSIKPATSPSRRRARTVFRHRRRHLPPARVRRPSASPSATSTATRSRISARTWRGRRRRRGHGLFRLQHQENAVIGLEHGWQPIPAAGYFAGHAVRRSWQPVWPYGLLEQTQLFSVTEDQGTTAAFRAGLTLALNMPTLTSSASIAAVAPNSSGAIVVSGSAPTILRPAMSGSSAPSRIRASVETHRPRSSPMHKARRPIRRHRRASRCRSPSPRSKSRRTPISAQASTLSAAHIGVSAATRCRSQIPGSTLPASRMSRRRFPI